MTTQEALQKIFTVRPDKWLRGREVKELLRLQLGYLPIEGEYRREFMRFRESFVTEDRKRVLKFWAMNTWFYTLSSNPAIIQKHNYALEKLRDNALKRKIAYNG